MSDLRTAEGRITSRKTEHLSEYVVGLVERWERQRDVNYKDDWDEYYRLWKGEWSAQDRDRDSERCKAIMPAISQAVDSAVSEVEEAIFGQERWFDIDSDNPNTQQDEGGPGRTMADNLLYDLRNVKSAISETVLLAAIYGTGIAKIVIREEGAGIRIELVPIEPDEFVIDNGAKTIEEAEGIAHCFTLPYHVVLQRQRDGIYEKVDPRIGVEPGDERHVDANVVHIIEYQGLVPKGMLPDVSDPAKKLPYEDDLPVEALVTVANNDTVLRAVENPLLNKDRGFIAFQWNTDPNKFYGIGIVEKGYWPQKILDGEVRARTDALAYSVHPMMAINAAAAPRGADFKVRPGRNIFLNGNPSDVLQPVNFPPPDQQTYVQAQEMQRQIEMATGQLQAATPFNANGRNETASGMSMMLGASIRRTRRTMANIERNFIRPFLRKTIERFVEFDPRYQPIPFEFKVMGSLGMMAREFESMQLGQLLNALPPGPAQFALLRAVVDNMSITNKQDVLRLLDVLTAEALEPPPPPPRDLGGEARMLSAQTRAQEVHSESQFNQQKLQLESARLQLEALNARRNNEREVMRISVDAERAESDDVQKTSQAILNLAKAEAEELGQQLQQYKKAVSEMPTSGKTNDGESIDISKIQEELESLRQRVEQVPDGDGGLSSDDISPIVIERNAEGLVTSINGRAVQRNNDGLIVEVN